MMNTEKYESPQAEPVEISAENVFCVSGQNEQYGYEDFEW